MVCRQEPVEFRIDLLGNDNKQTGWIFRNLCNY